MQRRQGAPITCASADFRPGCASEIASWTPTRPRATSERRNSRQNASVSAAPMSRPMISRRRLVNGVRDNHALALNAAAGADLLDLRVDEQVRVAALQRPLAKRGNLLVEQPGNATDLALADAQPEALNELIDAAS